MRREDEQTDGEGVAQLFHDDALPTRVHVQLGLVDHHDRGIVDRVRNERVRAIASP